MESEYVLIKKFGSFSVGSKKLDYKWAVYPGLGAHLEDIFSNSNLFDLL